MDKEMKLNKLRKLLLGKKIVDVGLRDSNGKITLDFIIIQSSKEGIKIEMAWSSIDENYIAVFDENDEPIGVE